MTNRARQLKLHRKAESRLQDIARSIDDQLPNGICFALVTFTPGAGGYSGYVSSAQRDDMIAALRECADVLEAKRDVPPGQPIDLQ